MTVSPQTNTTLEEIADALMKLDRIAICGHVNPDGDCIGSTLGLACALEAVGKTTFPLVADEEPLDGSFSFMKGFERLVPAASFAEPIYAFVMVDAPNASRIGDAAQALKDSVSDTFTIDHHAVPKRHSALSYTDPDAASTTMLVWQIAGYLGISRESEQMRDVATCCYAGLVTDTGRFMYQNTNGDAFRLANEMVECGASPSAISTSLFQERTRASVEIDSICVSRMKVIGDDAVLSWITLADMQELGADKHDAENAIAPIRAIKGINVACLLKEREGCVRGSLRAKDSTDVSAIAREFGGGGHVAAAGFTLECGLAEAISIVEDRLSRL